MDQQRSREAELLAQIETLQSEIMQMNAKIDFLTHALEARTAEVQAMHKSVADAQQKMEECVHEHERLAVSL